MRVEADKQRRYYMATAHDYDAAHASPEHDRALHIVADAIESHGIGSILDVGAGTGRAMVWLRQRFPALTRKGVEPVAALRDVAQAKGIAQEDLLPGDGYSLPFADNSFDLVCAFAVLHHVRFPGRVVAEMSRVATKMLAISDANFMGQGPLWLRYIKAGIFKAGLWPLANLLKTGGRGYSVSEEDGIAYSYSVFQSLPQIRQHWHQVTLFPTKGESAALTRAPHLLLLAVNPRTEASANPSQQGTH